MASWQTHAVCVYLRVTRKKRYRTIEAGLRSMADGIPAAPLPDDLRDRTRSAPLAGGEVVTVRPADGIVAGAGALVYLHGGAFVNGIQPQHWSLIGHLADSTHRAVHVARYPLAPEHDVTHAEAFLAALHDRFAPDGPLHVIGDSAGGTLVAAAGPGPRRRGHHRRADPHRAVARPVDDQPGRGPRRAARPVAHPRGDAADRRPTGWRGATPRTRR